ncbi:ankyrin repeat-containing domain protein [Syncephalastrum racemosum]|uniref:Ankyrin repeat-containing domain protein n=1 Tax=Syncephalastrum racemosum TaxID=13706 RepID=A0A1X2HT97_SYNRA|nr:ankyrin repeat-containing domain protein [Syncephalastrum racemosum]
MFGDEREETLREVAALGNTRAVQHFAKAGVNLNSQNAMNGWTALHWAAHRGHVDVVRALLSNGARPELKTNKGQTALSLAQRHPDIVDILSRIDSSSPDAHDPGAEPDLPIVPKYMQEPDLEKAWLHPDEFSENKIENVVRARAAVEATALDQALSATVPLPKTELPSSSSSLSSHSLASPASAQAQVQAKAPAEEKEILVYLTSRSDDHILGSTFLKNESIQASLDVIRNVRKDL